MKPIPFNTEMVRAIQNGTKTVTRRVVRPRFCDSVLEMFRGQLCEASPHRPPIDNGDGTTTRFVRHYVPCKPPYHPGDILYVRETWAEWPDLFGEFPEYIYRADYSDEAMKMDDSTEEVGSDFPACVKWRPSIHMPREAARIFLRVADVRVQQLKDVTEEGARAEGFGSRAEFVAAILKMYPDCTEENWTWVIEFERISREEAMQSGL